MNIKEKKVTFEILPGDKSIFEIWKCEDGNRSNKLGIINDLQTAIQIVEKLKLMCG